jgi:kumamolisin
MSGTHVVLSGSDRPRKRGAERVGDIDPAARIEVTVSLRGPRLPETQAGESITREQLEREYAASSEDIAAVEKELGQYGLTVHEVVPSAWSMRVSGSAAQMEAAFRARLAVYRTDDQGDYRGREGSLEVPAALDEVVTGVFGLDQRRVARRQPGVPSQGAAAPSAATALSPGDLEQRYHFPPGRAEGQTIAIAEFGGAYFSSDLAAYCREVGRPAATVSQVGLGVPVLTEQQVMQLPPAQRQQVLDASGEVNMDVQIIAGLCPDADIVVYFTQFDQKGWVDLVNEIIKGKPAGPVAVSVSWGLAEDSADFSAAARNAINRRLHAAAALGVTFCVSSGDDGSGDQVDDGAAHVNFPASSPYVLAVGGTMLDGQDEVVWWQPPGERKDGGGATGGGVSTVFKRPAWQTVQITSLNEGSIDGRVIPDVAALAGPPFYQLVFLGKPAPNGGTSASAPLWASLIGRSAAAQSPARPPAFLAPLLYQAGPQGHPLGQSVCRDITSGNNRSPKPGVGYDAAAGFDAVTGWGVPDGPPRGGLQAEPGAATAKR